MEHNAKTSQLIFLRIYLKQVKNLAAHEPHYPIELGRR